MILSDRLHASAKRVVLEYSSIVRLNACCAPSVMLRDVGNSQHELAYARGLASEWEAAGPHVSRPSRIGRAIQEWVPCRWRLAWPRT